MRRKSQNQPAASPEFVLHIPTGRVGIVTGARTKGLETYKTIRLAEGELVVAPARECKPATDREVEMRHRVAASVRPLTLPNPPIGRPSFHSDQPGHRLGG
jgi:hypothetical protein